MTHHDSPSVDEELGGLTAAEFTLIADYNNAEREVWSQVAAQEEDADRKVKYQNIADHHRDRSRAAKECAAREELSQTEYEDNTSN